MSRAKKTDGSCLDGIPLTLPALVRGLEVGKRAAAVGFDWPDFQGVRKKIEEEWQELLEEVEKDSRSPEVEDELGDLLFALSNLARHLGLNPETALQRGIDKFESRFRHVEKLWQKSDMGQKTTLDELHQLWEIAKSRERGPNTDRGGS